MARDNNRLCSKACRPRERKNVVSQARYVHAGKTWTYKYRYVHAYIQLITCYNTHDLKYAVEENASVNNCNSISKRFPKFSYTRDVNEYFYMSLVIR